MTSFLHIFAQKSRQPFARLPVIEAIFCTVWRKWRKVSNGYYFSDCSQLPQRVQPLQMIFIPQVWHFSPKYGL